MKLMKFYPLVFIVTIALSVLIISFKKHTSISEVYICNRLEKLHPKSNITFSPTANLDTCGWVMAKITETGISRKVYVY